MKRRYTKKPKAKVHRTPAGTPDFRRRSKLELHPGCWKMRNGHVAEISRAIPLTFNDALGKPQIFPVWFGKCLDCSEHKTWNINGTYAANGEHANDIVGNA